MGDCRGTSSGKKIAQGPHHPGTSQPSVGTFEETFARLIEAGHPVLCPTITSKHSGTFNSAWAAAQRFGERVRVMDTLSLSLGQGFQAMAAAEAAMKGLSLDEVAGLAEEVRQRTHVFILLDTIEYIRRGGRVDGRSNRRIAQELALSESTVAKHLTSVFNKLGVDNRAAAAAFAIRHGLA